MPPPLIVHVIHHLGVGGLENGLINLINHIPPERYRHTIVCLKDYSAYHAHIKDRGVEIISLNKREGKDLGHYMRMYRTLRALRPDLIHTRNLPGFAGQLVAALAGIKLRVHGEHGRDMADLYGKRLKYQLLRRALRPLIGHFIAVSTDLEHWLIDSVGAEPERVSQISNGVDSIQFHPRLRHLLLAQQSLFDATRAPARTSPLAIEATLLRRVRRFWATIASLSPRAAVKLIQVAPPDEQGNCSLGVSVEDTPQGPRWELTR